MAMQPLSIFVMKLFLRWFIVLGLSAATGAAQSPADVRPDTPRNSTCGPPQCCARTDRRVEP